MKVLDFLSPLILLQEEAEIAIDLFFSLFLTCYDLSLLILQFSRLLLLNLLQFLRMAQLVSGSLAHRLHVLLSLYPLGLHLLHLAHIVVDSLILSLLFFLALPHRLFIPYLGPLGGLLHLVQQLLLLAHNL